MSNSFSTITPSSGTEVKKIQCSHCGSWHLAQGSGVHHKDYFDCPMCLKTFEWNWAAAGPVPPESLPRMQACANASCHHVYPLSVDMCPMCGAYRSKATTVNMEKMWEELMARPMDKSRHEEFIAFCARRGKLNWAEEKYRVVYQFTKLEFFANMEKLTLDQGKVRQLQARKQSASFDLKAFVFGLGRQAVLWWRSLDRIQK